MTAVFFVFGIPFLVRHTPLSFEESLARRIGNPTGMPVCELNPEVQKILDTVVQRIYPVNEYEKKLPPISVSMINSKQVNAFATLGRKVFVFQGLLDKAQTPEELAGVLAHEMEHIRHRHVLESVVNQLVISGSFWVLLGGRPSNTETLGTLFDLKFSRQKEQQADQDGLKRLQKAKVSSQGILDFFSRLQKETQIPAILSDHPAFGERLAWIKEIGPYETLPILEDADWQKLKAGCSTPK